MLVAPSFGVNSSISRNNMDTTIVKFINAVSDGDERTALSLLLTSDEKKRSIINGENADGFSALMLGVKKNDETMVSFLLDLGADVNMVSSRVRKESALALAVRMNHDNMVSLLLDRGANVNIKSNGDTVLMIAVKTNNERLASLLLSRGASGSVDYYGHFPLMIAVKNNNENMVSLLLDGGVYIDSRHHKYAFTSLMLAVSNNNASIVSRLLNRGANVNATERVSIPIGNQFCILKRRCKSGLNICISPYICNRATVPLPFIKQQITAM